MEKLKTSINVKVYVFYEAKHQKYCASVTACMKSRLAWSDLTLIRDIITVLATQGWQKCLDEEECESETDVEIEKVDPLEPIERLGARFKIPLQAAELILTSYVMNFMICCYMQHNF